MQNVGLLLNKAADLRLAREGASSVGARRFRQLVCGMRWHPPRPIPNRNGAGGLTVALKWSKPEARKLRAATAVETEERSALPGSGRRRTCGRQLLPRGGDGTESDLLGGSMGRWGERGGYIVPI